MYLTGKTNFFTRLVLILALTFNAASGFSQESKPKQGVKDAVESPPTPAVEYDPRSWKEFSDERAMFSIMFPGTPVEADNTSGELTGRKFTLKTSAVYFVGYHDFPANFSVDLEKETALRKQWFDASRDTTVSGSQAKVLNETQITIDDHPGYFMKLALPSGGVLRESRYIVGKRAYQVLVVTPRELLAPDGGKFDETRATKFLTSFRLAKPTNNDGRDQLNSSPGSAADFFRRCFARYKQKDWDGAIADCSKAIELDPQLRASYLMRGLIRRDVKGNLDGAIADFDYAIKLDPTVGELYVSRAWARYKQNDLDGAIADYSTAIEKDPSAENYLQRGSFRLAKGDLDKAIDDFNIVIEKSPESVESYALRGKARYLKKDFDGCIADFAMVIKLDPQSVDAHAGRGLALLFIGKDTEAQKDFDKFLELAPDKKSVLEKAIENAKRERAIKN